MAVILIIPILIVTIIGLSSYLAYRFLVYDLYCKRSVNKSLQKYNIKKTPSQIIKAYYENKGESISHQEIQNLWKAIGKLTTETQKLSKYLIQNKKK